MKLNKKIIITFLIILGIGFFTGCIIMFSGAKALNIKVSSYYIENASPINSDMLLDSTNKAHILTVNLTNNSENIFVLMPSTQFRLKIDNSYYMMSPDKTVTKPLAGGEVKPSQSVSGQISFHAPSEQKGILEFRTDINADWHIIN